MKRLLYILISLCLLTEYGFSQATGTWHSYLACDTTWVVAEGNNYVFAMADGTLYSYGKEDQSVKVYSKQTGLSDTKVAQIGYNPEVNTLLIVYSNGNIDMLGEKGIYNLPYLMNNTNIPDKTINGVYFYKEYAYLPSEFGILVINMKKQEITDTYKLNKSVYSLCINGNTLFAATSEGILTGDMSKNLLDANNWKPYVLNSTGFDSADIRHIDFFQNTLCFFVKKNGVYSHRNDNTIQPLVKDANIQNMTLQNGTLIAYTTNSAMLFSSLTESESINTGQIMGISSLKDANTYWIAAGTESIKSFRKKGTSYELTVSGLHIEGPKRNFNDFMTMHNQKLLIAGGGRWTNRENKPGTFMVYNEGKWFNFDEKKILNQINMRFSDVTCVAVDPNDENHYFASTWGEGLFEFKDNEYVNLYTYQNSTLSTIYPNGDKNHYIRVEGLCYDKAGNLWMTNSGVQEGIKVMKADGTWSSLYYKELSDVNLIDKILIAQNGYKWINVLRDQSGIFVLNDNKTIDDTSDDTYQFFSSLQNAKGENLDVSGFYCVSQDKNGAMWIGTNTGPVICYSPSVAVEKLRFSRIVRVDENGLPLYFLDGQKVTAIAVDGGNRKWIGTESSGVFLVDENGQETLENFTTENSPLLSNNIKSIAINDVTGEVFFGTNEGLISYMGGATEGSEDYSDIYAYPNPVRPEYEDQVTITGLMSDSNVKITDISGNIIYQGKSTGGQLVWNCRTAKGGRVATGIYLVMAATPEAKESVVTKIMVIQ